MMPQDAPTAATGAPDAPAAAKPANGHGRRLSLNDWAISPVCVPPFWRLPRPLATPPGGQPMKGWVVSSLS
jgi:hypothetical protein